MSTRGTAGFPDYAVRLTDRVRGEASGYFRVEEQDGTWWMIDPNGYGFFMLATDHISYRVHQCQVLGYSPHHRYCEEAFGSEEEWARTVGRRLAEWNFNTLAVRHSEYLRHTSFAHIETLSVGTRFTREVDSITPSITWTGFPNVFSPEWPEWCDQIAREMCAPNAEDPWLIGYFLDNELQWHGERLDRRNHNGMAKVAWKNRAGHPAKQAWIDTVREHTSDIAQFNNAWGSDFASFAELEESTDPYAPATDLARETCRAFVRKTAERYFGETAAAIRRHDPNHLVLGARFAGWAPDIWDIAGKHCDVVSFNNYPAVDIDYGVPEDLVEWYRDIYAQTKRPLMMTEWSFLSVGEGLPGSRGGGMKVRNQADRAKCFRTYQSTLLSLPFFVGSHYFMYADEPLLGIREYFSEDGNYGLVNYREEPYDEFVAAVADVQSRVVDLHSKGDLEYIYAPRADWQRTLPSQSLWPLVPGGPEAPGADAPAGHDTEGPQPRAAAGSPRRPTPAAEAAAGAPAAPAAAAGVVSTDPLVVRAGDLQLSNATIHGCGWSIRLWARLDHRHDPPGYEQEHPLYPHIVGRFDPFVLHGASDLERTQSRTTKVTDVRRDDEFVVVDLRYIRTAEPGARGTPGRYAYDLDFRFWFPLQQRSEAGARGEDPRGEARPAASWFVSQALAIRNTGTVPLPVRGISHNVVPLFDTVPCRQNLVRTPVRSYHMPVNAWELPLHQLGVGAVALDDGMAVDFFRRNDECFSDCRLPIDVVLEPGQSASAAGGVTLSRTTTGAAAGPSAGAASKAAATTAVTYAYRIENDDTWLDLAERIRVEARRLGG